MVYSDIKSMSDKEILDDLQAMGIPATLEHFRKAALIAETPSKLSDEWAYLHGIQGPPEDFLYEACLELWKRHLSDMKCVEVVQDSICDHSCPK